MALRAVAPGSETAFTGATLTIGDRDRPSATVETGRADDVQNDRPLPGQRVGRARCNGQRWTVSRGVPPAVRAAALEPPSRRFFPCRSARRDRAQESGF